MIVLIDTGEGFNNLSKVWDSFSFIEKMQEVDTNLLLWNSRSLNLGISLPTISTFEELIDYAKLRRENAVIYVEGTQVFIDVDLVNAGLSGKMGERIDYFTQWEQCRIPVGIGIRAFSIESLQKSGAETTPQHIDFIRNNPQQFRIKYDDRAYVDYETSLLDARYSEALMEALNWYGNKISFDLKGFMTLAKATKDIIPVYEPEKKARWVDEREMPAPYGFESSECAEFPTYIMFDITNICNSQCIHCPHSTTYSKSGISPVFIEMDIFRKVIDECVGKKMEFIRITADGEPLLHKKVIEMVEYASRKGVGPVGLTTNGSLMTPDTAVRLIDAGLFMVDFSLDAVKPETYKEIRRGLPYDKVTKNIEHILELRNKKQSSLKVMVSFVKQEENQHEVQEFIDRWEMIVDRVLIRQLISNVNLVDIKMIDKPKRDQRWACPHWFRRIVINYNGEIKACPVDWENRSIYKHVSETTVYDAWHSEFYWRNRVEHLNKKFSSNSLCRNCSDWQGSPWHLGYEKVVGGLKED
ncbi:MAG: radical SAM protein [Deltaproteobacteria bacterium]|nr:radical SAM protein [Deltaproteobacteria bacterium]